MSLIDRIQYAIVNSVEYAEYQLPLIGVFGAICFPLFYVLWTYVFPQPYENLGLRLVAGLLCLTLIFHKQWPLPIKRFIPLIWYFIIAFALPFFFSFMTFMNQWNNVWVMSTLIASFLLILLVDWISMSILFLLGFLSAWLVSSFFLPMGGQLRIEDVLIISFALIAGYLFNYKIKILRREKFMAMSLISGSIAHELRTPLLGIKSGAVGIKRYMPVLFEAYELALEHGLNVKKIRRVHYESLTKTLGRIESETNNANTIIDILLMNVGRQAIAPSTFERCSMVKAVEEAIRRYPFTSQEERDKVVWRETCDFDFYGTRVLMVHVLFNLIKNALHFIAKARKGDIHIWLEQSDKLNQLYLKDTGKGISAEFLPRVFERFFSTTISGTGIGLSFCRLVIESFGGTIQCTSEEGEYTQFIISFPKGTIPVGVTLQDDEKAVN